MLTVRLMAANRLATNSQSWFDTISHQNGGASALQWISFEPRSITVLLVEQLPRITVAMNYTEKFKKIGFISYIGISNFQNINDIVRPAKKDVDLLKTRLMRLQENITTFEQFRNFMRGCSQEGCTSEEQNSKTSQLRELTYRGDLEDIPVPYGIIDTKILAICADGLKSFEATSGPSTSQSRTPFQWSKSFPNISHVGHPDSFEFKGVTPRWVWA